MKTKLKKPTYEVKVDIVVAYAENGHSCGHNCGSGCGGTCGFKD